MNYIEIHNLLNEDLINGILREAWSKRGKKLIFPDTPHLHYSSCDNGWMCDPLAAIFAAIDAALDYLIKNK